MSFETALSLVLRFEGGKSDHPADRGGRTNKGVIQRVYDQYRVSRGLEKKDVFDIDDSEVADIYRRNYWDVAHCNDVPEPVATVLFDSAVNCGPRQATKWLQRAVKTSADGVFGPATKAAVAASDPVDTAYQMIEQREDFYHHLTTSDPRQIVFLKGWLNRLDALRRAVA